MKNPDNPVYISHIKDACESIFKFIENKNFDEFSKNDMLLSAIIRKLEIIGEASNKISEEFKESNPDIPWRLLIGMRNSLIHGYFGVHTKTVWDTVKEDIPALYFDIVKIFS